MSLKCVNPTNCEMHFVGWLLDETMGRPGLPTLCILLESCNDAVYVESPLRTFAIIVLRILTAHANYARYVIHESASWPFRNSAGNWSKFQILSNR